MEKLKNRILWLYGLMIVLSNLLFAQTTTQTGISLIKHYEGFRRKAYLCPAKVLTIGIGHTGIDVKPGMIITEKQAEELLIKDLIRFEKYVRSKFIRVLKWNEFDALISFSYNCGFRFKGNYLKSINTGNTKLVIYYLSQYNKARVEGILKILPGLVKRRKSESTLYKDAILIFK